MIKAIITDFDGTLVDTFEANLLAYQQAFAEVGIALTEGRYRECFGYRFDRFMLAMGINDVHIASTIKEAKKAYYPQHFARLRPNHSLIALLRSWHGVGMKTAIASTARKENLMNAIQFLGIADVFDLIYAGVDVKQGKPSPEIYNKAMAALAVVPEQTLIFEDSAVGIAAAKASGANCLIVSQQQFEFF